jgi:hypothetical protein
VSVICVRWRSTLTTTYYQICVVAENYLKMMWELNTVDFIFTYFDLDYKEPFLVMA